MIAEPLFALLAAHFARPAVSSCFRKRQMLAGHRPQGTTAKNYEHLSPSYLRAAIVEVDAFFDELSKHTRAHLRYARDTQLELHLAA
jgi:hypothetical protein